MAFTDTLESPKCNSDKAMVGSVVCTVYTDGQPYKPCILCETGFKTCQITNKPINVNVHTGIFQKCSADSNYCGFYFFQVNIR